jgi:hypothetical protein
MVAFLMLMTASTAIAQIAHGYSNVFTVDTVASVDGEESPPLVTALISIYPNPFNPLSTIEFELAESGSVELAVFDLRGRLVRVLDRESRSRGQYRTTWNGRDEDGRAMPAGTYFCRLVTSGGAQTMKLTLVQ